MASEVRRLERDLQDVATVLQEWFDLEYLGRRIDVHAAQRELGMGECLPYGLSQLGLVHAELADRAAHAHPRAHELRFRVDPEPHPDGLAGLPCYPGEAVDLAQGLDV